MPTSEKGKTPIVVVISGPSGVGKDVVIDAIIDKDCNFHHIVTATTRKKRPGEIEGADYYFLSRREFKRKIEARKFMEYAEVYGNYYGVLRSEVQRVLRGGKDAILKVDVQGAATLKKKIPGALFIFLAPSSIEELLERMKNRNADSEETIRKRVEKANAEMSSQRFFDHVVVNYKDNLDKTVKTVNSHIKAYRRKNNLLQI